MNSIQRRFWLAEYSVHLVGIGKPHASSPSPSFTTDIVREEKKYFFKSTKWKCTQPLTTNEQQHGRARCTEQNCKNIRNAKNTSGPVGRTFAAQNLAIANEK